MFETALFGNFKKDLRIRFRSDFCKKYIFDQQRKAGDGRIFIGTRLYSLGKFAERGNDIFENKESQQNFPPAFFLLTLKILLCYFSSTNVEVAPNRVFLRESFLRF